MVFIKPKRVEIVSSDLHVDGPSSELQDIGNTSLSSIDTKTPALQSGTEPISDNSSSITYDLKNSSPKTTWNRPADTTAYSSGDVVGSSSTATHAVTNAGSNGSLIEISSVSLLINVSNIPVGMTSFRLHIYSETPVTLADNTPYLLSAGDRSRYCGYIDLNTPELIGNGYIFKSENYIGRPIRLINAGFFFHLVVTGASGYTPASATEYSVGFNCIEVGSEFSDVDALGFIRAVQTADGQSLEYPIRRAYNEFVAGCKEDDNWDSIEACCIPIGARTLSGALIPLVGPAPTNVDNLLDSDDYDRSLGLKGDGVEKCLDSNYAYTSGYQNDCSLAIYETEATLVGVPAGYNDSSGNGTTISSSGIRLYNNLASTHTPSDPTIAGFKGISRNSSGTYEYLSKDISNTNTATSAVITQGNIGILAQNTNGTFSSFSTSRIAFYAAGNNLNLTLLNARVNTLIRNIQAALNTQWITASSIPTLDLRMEDILLKDSVTNRRLVTHTRASPGTYVGSDGLIKSAATNLLLQSEDFATTWTNVQSSENTNVAVAPDGTTTADALVDTVNSAPHNIGQNVAGLAGSTNYTFSCYMKKGSKDFSALIFNPNASWGAGAAASAYFDLVNGTVSATSFTTATIQALPNGWYRCTATAPTVASPGTVTLRVASSLTGNTQTYTGVGDEAIYVWGAQLEEGSTATEYLPTGATINSAPRITHDPTTGRRLGLLVEEARTNLLLRSEEFDGAGWTISNATVTANSTVSPSGEQTADKLVATGGSGDHTAYQSFAVTSGTSYTFSCYLKAAERTSYDLAFRVAALWPGALNQVATFDLVAGTATVKFGSPSTSITPLTNGWYRCSVTSTASASGTGQVRPQDTFDANGEGVYLWGAQLEEGSFPTSYIPTTGTTVTRTADLATITGANFSSWYRQDEGTMFADFNGTNIASGQFPRIFEFNDGTSSNLIRVQQYNAAANAVRASVVTATVGQFAADNGSVAVGVRGKTAFGSALNDVALVTNGASPTTEATYLVPSGLTQLGIGHPPAVSTSVLNSTIRRLTFWPARLPNSTLQNLTA